MACCGGNVNVVSRDDAPDFTDASTQTDESYCKKEDDDDDDEEISENDGSENKDVEETFV